MSQVSDIEPLVKFETLRDWFKTVKDFDIEEMLARPRWTPEDQRLRLQPVFDQITWDGNGNAHAPLDALPIEERRRLAKESAAKIKKATTPRKPAAKKAPAKKVAPKKA